MPKYRAWEPKEVAYLRKAREEPFPTTYKEIAAKLGRGESAVRMKAKSLGLKAKRVWERNDIVTLLDLAKRKTVPQIVKAFRGRFTAKQIYRKLHELDQSGLRPDESKWYRRREVTNEEKWEIIEEAQDKSMLAISRERNIAYGTVYNIVKSAGR